MPNATENAIEKNFYFQFTLNGRIESEDGVSYLVSRDDIRFRLKGTLVDPPEGIVPWLVIPTTDSTAMIQTLSIESYVLDDTAEDFTETCWLLGRVVQLGKRGQFVQLKIPRPGEKTLKISLRCPDPRMKIGEVWQVVALRQGVSLYIQQATPVEEVSNSFQQVLLTSDKLPVVPVQLRVTTTFKTVEVSDEEQEAQDSERINGISRDSGKVALSPPLGTQGEWVSHEEVTENLGLKGEVVADTTPIREKGFDIAPPTESDETSIELLTFPRPQQLVLDSEMISPPTEKAIAALIAETQKDNWKLGKPKQRSRRSWEWEAVHPTTQVQARVQVFGGRKKPIVYQYPTLANGSSPEGATPIDAAVEEPVSQRLVVTPLGAARGIGASCFQILIGPYEVVLDCGTRPKGYDPLPALEHLENPNLLLISHAHQDHLGAVPVFHNRFPGVRMIATNGTREIAHVMLQDCLKVQQLNEDSPQLFDEVDLERTLFRVETQPPGIDFEPLPGLKVRFINAGHILGAACIYLQYGERSLLYTGDYNTTSSRTTTGLRLADLPNADILITESTYGADVHPARKTQETALIEAIAEVVQAGGNVLIPAFALGRAQEILLAIRTSHLFHKLRIHVYVDGLVRAVTDVFRNNLEFLPDSVQNLVKQNAIEPFLDPTGTPPVIPISSPKERPLAMARPSVIIASSGMLTGGPSVYYAAVLLERENAAIFISGYTDEESPGRLLQNLQTGDQIELDGKQVTVRAQIRRFNLSAHADKIGLTQVINKVNPKHLVLIHGGGNALHELAKSGDLRSKHFIHIPCVGEKVEYGQAPEHLTSSQISRIELPQEFEVEVASEVEGAWIRIPEEVVETDPRWSLLASNGILKAKWDGFHLKLSPVTQQGIVQQKEIEEAIASGEPCCAVCKFFELGNCQCEASPLFELQVDPKGKCTEFTRFAAS